MSSGQSASRWASTFASSAQSCSPASGSSSVITVKFHPTTLSWSPSSCLSASTSNSISKWSDPVSWSSARINHVVISQFTNVKSMTDSPLRSSLALQCVGYTSFRTSNPFPLINSFQKIAIHGPKQLMTHRLLCALKSPARTVLPSQMTHYQFNIRVMALLTACLSDRKCWQFSWSSPLSFCNLWQWHHR